MTRIRPAQPPFEGEDIYDKIAKGDYAFPEDVEVSDDAKASDPTCGLTSNDLTSNELTSVWPVKR